MIFILLFFLLGVAVLVIFAAYQYFEDKKELEQVNKWAREHGKEEKTYLGDF